MKMIGLIGGMSWQSSALYYRLLNEETRRRLGGQHNARSLMSTVDFAEVERFQHQGNWQQLGAILAETARQLERGGADFIVLCTNTMHKEVGAIERSVRIPLLHIIDATAAAIKKAGHRRVGLLGTRFTVEDGFYTERLHDRFGIQTVVPAPASRQLVHDVIYQELCQGVIRPDSRMKFQEVIREMCDSGAEGVVLGCTEVELLISDVDSQVPVYASTAIHASAAVDLALQRNEPTERK